MNVAEEAAGLPPTSSYRYATRVGNQLFVAGQVPHEADATLVGDGKPAAQVTQCLTNLRMLVRVHSFDDGVIQHLTIYFADEHANLLHAWSGVERSTGASRLLRFSA
jgi:enamine deaminase RidA (YjgF/YER057c/UK114 family)